MSKVKHIFCIMGYSGTGKDTIVKALMENIPKDIQLKTLVSHTTRPMRVGEMEGVEYYFIDNDTFLQMKDNKEFIENRVYYTKKQVRDTIVDDIWYYGLSKKEVEETEYGLFIVDVQGYEELAKHYGKNVVIPIIITTDDNTLRTRAINRGDCLEEFERRLADDKKQFANLTKARFEIPNNNGDLKDTIFNVKSVIEVFTK